ncbi:hypothetical protein INR49_028632 [Caranx melampygus]|nr:hypothetical protein INR49_028632 [Caranx melampygus]
MKLEGTFEYISIESTIRAKMDGTVLENYLVFGVLDNEINQYLNNDGLRSTSKIIADAKLNHGTNKVIGIDVNENLAVEASLKRVYAVLEYTGNNEANLFNLNTNGKHITKVTIDLAPMSSLMAAIELDISQPSSLGEFSIFEKTVAEVTTAKQKMSTNAKFVSPLYTTNLAAEIEGNIPVFKVTFKSAATSVIVFLEYDLDSSIVGNFEHGGLSLTGKMVFTHDDLTVDIQNILSHTPSDSGLTLNMDITSPAFTDLNLRYAVRKDGISATISIPSTGLLGLQLHGRTPSQMNARLYGRYASDPGNDVDIFTIRASAKDANRMNFKMSINMDTPNIMLRELNEKIPAITSCLSSFAEKYQLFSHAAQLKNIIIFYVEKAHNIENVERYLPPLSALFRKTVVQYQKTIEVFLDAAIKFLRETRVKLPGSDHMTTLLEVLNKTMSSITSMVGKALQLLAINVEYALNFLLGMVSKIQVTMPVGDVMAIAKLRDQIRNSVKTMFNPVVDYVNHPESFDMLLEKLSDTLKLLVDKAQDYVDYQLRSPLLQHPIAFCMNYVYDIYIKLVKAMTEYANTSVDTDSINNIIYYILDIFRSKVNEFRYTVTGYLQRAPAQYRSYVKVKGTKLEISF